MPGLCNAQLISHITQLPLVFLSSCLPQVSRHSLDTARSLFGVPATRAISESSGGAAASGAAPGPMLEVLAQQREQGEVSWSRHHSAATSRL